MMKKTHKIFSYFFERDQEDHTFLSSYLNDFNIIKKRYALYRYLPHKLFYKYIEKDVKYIFVGMKYIDLIKNLSPNKSMVLDTIRNRKLVKDDKNIFIFPLNYFVYSVQNIFRTDTLLEKKSSKYYIDYTVGFFKTIQPKFLIVSNDSLFVERFLIYCAKEAGISTICIQDGIFVEESNSKLLHGKYADYMYAWSENQRSILLNAGGKPSHVKILGYPYNVPHTQSITRVYNKSKICILGQPWERFDIELGKKKKYIFEQIIAECTGIDIFYKTHPAEKDINYFPEDVCFFRGTLNEAIEEYDYFLSLTSTALLEVSMAGKIGIQIYDTDFKCGKFEKIGWSYTYDFFQNTNIREYIDAITKPFSIDKSALFVPENIGDRFLDLEKEIEIKN